MLPGLIILSSEMISDIVSMKEINLNTDTIYPNVWACDDLQMIIPDFATDKKTGYYLRQTIYMHRIRDETFQCGLCLQQFRKPDFKFCPYCIQDYDLNIDLAYLTYLRPVSTWKLKVDKKSIRIPDHLIIPELLPTGKMIRL